MKKFEMPNIEVMFFDVEDVIATSDGNWVEGTPSDDD